MQERRVDLKSEILWKTETSRGSTEKTEEPIITVKQGELLSKVQLFSTHQVIFSSLCPLSDPDSEHTQTHAQTSWPYSWIYARYAGCPILRRLLLCCAGDSQNLQPTAPRNTGFNRNVRLYWECARLYTVAFGALCALLCVPFACVFVRMCVSLMRPICMLFNEPWTAVPRQDEQLLSDWSLT